jgi:predicted DNA-binding antitoxin AbrB/MazE fold protein
MGEDSESSGEKPSVTLPGTVEKVIKPVHPSLPEKVQISIEGADDLYREIRVENVLTDEHGQKVALKEGEEVQVKVEGERKATDKTP